MKPDSWLASALDTVASKAFKVLSTTPVGNAMRVRVLHKETGAVWRFDCYVEREATE